MIPHMSIQDTTTSNNITEFSLSVIGSWASVISVPLAIWFWWDGRQNKRKVQSKLLRQAIHVHANACLPIVVSFNTAIQQSNLSHAMQDFGHLKLLFPKLDELCQRTQIRGYDQKSIMLAFNSAERQLQRIKFKKSHQPVLLSSNAQTLVSLVARLKEEMAE